MLTGVLKVNSLFSTFCLLEVVSHDFSGEFNFSCDKHPRHVELWGSGHLARLSIQLSIRSSEVWWLEAWSLHCIMLFP